MYDWLDTPHFTRAAGWLLTYAVHSTVLLTVAAILAPRLAAWRPALAETLWRGALVGGLLTASLPRLASWWPSPAETPTDPSAGVAMTAHAASAPGLGTAAAEAFATWAVAAWGVVAAAFLVSLSVSWWRLRRRLAGRRPVVDGPLAATFQELRAAGGPCRARLTTSAALSVPVAFGLRRGEVCLPERAAAELSPGELRAVLSHELAHLERRDPAWRLLARLLAGVLFFQPLNRFAARRLERLSEYLCDDRTVARTGRPSELARCLAAVAGWTLERPRLFPVPGMAEGGSDLERRVRRLLDRGVDRRPGPRRRLAVAMAASLLAAAWLAPTWTVAAGPDVQEAEGESAASEDPAAEEDPAADETDDERRLRRLEAELRRREAALREQEEALRRQELALREQVETLRRQEQEIRRQAEDRAVEMERQARELQEHARQLSAEERQREEHVRAQARELEERVHRMMEEQREREARMVERARELEERSRRLAEEEERRDREETDEREESDEDEER